MKGHKSHHGAHGGLHPGYGHHAEHTHKHPRAEHARGGKTESPHRGDEVDDEAPHEVYEGAGSHVVHEAEEHRRGGKVRKGKRKHHVGHAEGEKPHHRADRAPRKSGGRAGSNFNPLSSAAHGHEPKGHGSYEPERD